MEKWDLYNKNRILTGETITRGQPIPKNNFYLVVMVIMQNDKGEFLLQKRSERKGGKWATTGGHPTTGQSSLEGILAEIKEELGLTADKNKIVLYQTIQDDDCFIDLYYLKQNFDLTDVVIQPSEVSDANWFTKKQIYNLINSDQFFKSHADIVVDAINKY